MDQLGLLGEDFENTNDNFDEYFCLPPNEGMGDSGEIMSPLHLGVEKNPINLRLNTQDTWKHSRLLPVPILGMLCCRLTL